MKINRAVACLLIFAFAVTFTSCSSNQQKHDDQPEQRVPVILATPQKMGMGRVETSGMVEASEMAILSTRVMGFVTAVNVNPGDRVVKGQLLVTISNNDIEAKRGQAEAMVRETEAALNNAKKDYDRYQELFRQESASEKELENVTLHYNAIKAKVDAALEMKKEADAMLSYTRLTAPFSGVVTQRHIDGGSMATPGAPLMAIERSGGYQVNSFVAESDIGKIKVDAVAEVELKALGRKIKGLVSEVSPSAGMSGGQYLVKIRLNKEELKGVFPGMYAHVVIETSESVDGNASIVVPASALIKRHQLNGLYTISESKTALLRWVTLGKTYHDRVEILSGLSEGEQFILSAKGRLYNGVPVWVNSAPLSKVEQDPTE